MIKRTLLSTVWRDGHDNGACYAQKIAVTKGQKLETITLQKLTMEVMGQNMDNESTLTSAVEVKDVTRRWIPICQVTNQRMIIK